MSFDNSRFKLFAEQHEGRVHWCIRRWSDETNGVHLVRERNRRQPQLLIGGMWEISGANRSANFD